MLDFKRIMWYIIKALGGIAQLVERLNGIQEVAGSTPTISTTEKQSRFFDFVFLSSIIVGVELTRVSEKYYTIMTFGAALPPQCGTHCQNVYPTISTKKERQFFTAFFFIQTARFGISSRRLRLVYHHGASRV